MSECTRPNERSIYTRAVSKRKLEAWFQAEIGSKSLVRISRTLVYFHTCSYTRFARVFIFTLAHTLASLVCLSSHFARVCRVRSMVEFQRTQSATSYYARSSLTEDGCVFALPPAACSNITPEEVRDGLLFEVNLVLNFLHFIFVMCVLGSAVFGVARAVCICVYLVWCLVQSGWAGGNRKTRQIVYALFYPFYFQFWINLGFLSVILLNLDIPLFNQTFIFNSGLNALWSLGSLHPYFENVIQTSILNVTVQSGIFAAVFVFGLSKTTEFGQIFFQAATLAIALITAGVAVSVAVAASGQPRTYLIYAPWFDIPLAIRSMLNFRSFTNLKLSAFMRLLDAHTDRDDSLSVGTPDVVQVETLVEWMGEERGVGTWRFLTRWKQSRLGKKVLDSDLVVPVSILDSLAVKSMQTSIEAQKSNPVIRSPLLRGY